MSLISGGRIVAQCLKNEGVTHLFTLCGGHIQDIYEGCREREIRVVDFRHEQAAAMAADGWARATGQPGVAAVTAGPGVTNAVTAVATARRSQSPMILIGGQGPKAFENKGSLQEMNHVELMTPITKWAAQVPAPERIPDYMAMAFRRATTGVPGPVFLEMPLDILQFPITEEAHLRYPKNSRTEHVPGGDPEAIRRAVELLQAAKRPVTLLGSQLWWSPYKEQVDPWQRRFQVPIYMNGMARGALAPDHPGWHYHSRSAAIGACDLAIIFGTPLDFRLGYGERIHEDAQIIHIDLDPEVPGHNRSAEVGIVGDTGLILKQMLEEAGPSPAERGEWFEFLAKTEAKKRDAMLSGIESDARPIDPLRFAHEVAKTITADTIVVGDGGDVVGTTIKLLPITQMGQWMDPGPLGTLGIGPSYAMAAQLAHPQKRVLIVFGDGSFGLNAMEFEAMVRQGIPCVGVIGNDGAWQQIRRGQVALYGEKNAVATALNRTPYHKMVESFGGIGEAVTDPNEIAPAIERAFASGRAGLVNVDMGTNTFRAGSISV